MLIGAALFLGAAMVFLLMGYTVGPNDDASALVWSASSVLAALSAFVCLVLVGTRRRRR